MEFKFKKEHINEFKKLGILTIYLFGSQASGKTHPLSDVDFGVLFEEPEKHKNKTMGAYLKLYDIFTDILPKDYLQKRFELKENELDIVFLQFAPIQLQFEALGGKVLYESNKERRLNYQEYVMKINADLAYFYDLRHEAILERI